KKKKKKKRKHKDDDDASETGGESNATTPGPCLGTPHERCGETTPPPSYGFVRVDSTDNKISLKISFKRPSGSEEFTLPNETNELPGAENLEAKKNKKKKNKEKPPKEHKSKRLHSSSDIASNVVTSISVDNAFSNPSSVNVDKMFPDPLFSQHGMQEQSQDLSVTTHDDIFDPLSAVTSADSLQVPSHSDALDSVISMVGSQPQNMLIQSHQELQQQVVTNFQHQPRSDTLFDELLCGVDPSLTLNQMSSVPIALGNATPVASVSDLHIMDYASCFLQNEIMHQQHEQPVGIQEANRLQHSRNLNSSFMIANQLDQDPNNVSLVDSHELQQQQGNVGFLNNFDDANISTVALDSSIGRTHIPMGLASYLTVSQQPQQPQHRHLQPIAHCEILHSARTKRRQTSQASSRQSMPNSFILLA
ncbi:unnamed protein product, partial [Protopolystoma xenopodis]